MSLTERRHCYVMHVFSIYGIYMHAIKLAGKVAKRRIKQD